MSRVEKKASARLDPGSNRSWAAAGADNDISAASSAQPLSNLFRVKIVELVTGQMVSSQIILNQTVERLSGLCRADLRWTNLRWTNLRWTNLRWTNLLRACMRRERALVASAELRGLRDLYV